MGEGLNGRVSPMKGLWGTIGKFMGGAADWSLFTFLFFPLNLIFIALAWCFVAAPIIMIIFFLPFVVVVVDYCLFLKDKKELNL